LLIEK